MDTLPSTEGLVIGRELRLLGFDNRSARHAVARGELTRLHRGVFVNTAEWAARDPDGRRIMQIIGAVSAGRTSPIVSHLSAALLHGAPVISPPKEIHVLATLASGTRTEHGFRKHATSDLAEGIEERGLLRVTDLERTCAEVAADSSLLTAVGVLDWALRTHGVEKQRIISRLDDLGIRRGRSRAIRAIEFADPRSESPGESLSRVRIHELGFPTPQLQVDFSDGQGPIGRVDFWWPDHNLIGEFDGVAKYIREEYTGGRDPGEVVIREKRREDRLRTLGPRMSRWMWDQAWNASLLFAMLRHAGLPTSRRSLR